MGFMLLQNWWVSKFESMMFLVISFKDGFAHLQSFKYSKTESQNFSLEPNTKH
jgi:hypothetical protein